jgi:hypothetical protein
MPPGIAPFVTIF